MTAVVTVRLAEPQFEGQTKEVLGTPAVSRLVAKAVEGELAKFLGATKAATRAQARAVLEKVVGASRARVAARQHREAQRRKNALESSSLPAKLVDCRSNDVDRSELFIVEGDSALGTAKLARNSEFQALAADTRKDPQRTEGLYRRHAEERRVRLDHPSCRRRLRPQLRHRFSPLRQDHLYGRCRLRRCSYSLFAGDVVLPVHAPAGGCWPSFHRSTTAAPLRTDQRPQGPGQAHLHLFRRGVPAKGGGADQEGSALRASRSATRVSGRWMPISLPRRR